MNLLICAATEREIAPLTDFLQKKEGIISGQTFPYNSHQITFLVTGIGGVSTAFSLGKLLQHKSFDWIIQAGIAGAFSSEIEIGSVWKVKEEYFADLGSETAEGFADLFDLHLQNAGQFPFEDKKITALLPVDCSLSLLPPLSAISVNRVSGSTPTIAERVEKYNPGLESMEGAAFFYVCKKEGIPFIEVRSVSNHVEIRDSSKWDIGLAVRNLNDRLIRFFKEDLKR